MHYTVPLTTAKSDGYVFPSEYIGQYGVFEAIKHIYQRNEGLRHLIGADGNELHVNKKYFTSELEKATQEVRGQFRTKHGINDD